ncbi:sigma-70 family RNA polymerase sigma factor [Falcatimonas sp. MSJ-15]|uniref:sigma-70 family RNA polymerase sigma factor n=1 Tax=Falcatimonas sp. MSJ-15 TaxID=2841515 RepID=UPI0035304D2A
MDISGISTNELIKLAHDGNKEARDRLVIDNTPLIWSIVKRFTGRGTENEDLFQIGTIGLIKAIDNFNTDMEVRLSTYAVPLIMGEIKRHLRDDGIIKISRQIKDNGIKVKRATDEYIKRTGEEPTVAQLSYMLGIDTDDIVMAIEAASQVESIYKPVYGNDGSEMSLIEKVMSDNDNIQSEDTEKNRLIDSMLLSELLKSLTREEQEIIRLRYYEELTQSDIARRYKTSQVQISRMEKKILLKLKKRVM